MNKKFLIPIALVAIITLGFYAFTKFVNKSSFKDIEMKDDNHSSAEESSMMENDKMMMSEKSYSLSEVANHANSSNCWIAIEGKVYDVTKFIPIHPGGEEILKGCGKDATSMFNSRPTDGTAHSERANENLENFLIGDLSK